MGQSRRYVWLLAPTLLLAVASPWLHVAGSSLVKSGLFFYFATTLTLYLGLAILVFRFAPWQTFGETTNQISTRWRIISAIGVISMSGLIWYRGLEFGLVSGLVENLGQKLPDTSTQSDYRGVLIGVLLAWWVASSWFGLRVAPWLLKWTLHLVAVLVLVLSLVLFCDRVVPHLIAPGAESFNLHSTTLAPEMVLIPEGGFRMGSPETEADRRSREGPQRLVHVKAFAMGRYEVTCEEYAVFSKDRPLPLPNDTKRFRNSDCGKQPAINVSWDDACAYAAWLSGKTGKEYRLPTEAEWEYAARAGTTTPHYWDNDSSNACTQANVFDLSFGCYDGALLKPAPVGQYQANAFGLHDTAGNVWEWVADCSHDDYQGAPSDGSVWEAKAGECGARVLRGGSWGSKPANVRSANRSGTLPDSRNDYIGFRLARTLK